MTASRPAGSSQDIYVAGLHDPMAAFVPGGTDQDMRGGIPIQVIHGSSPPGQIQDPIVATQRAVYTWNHCDDTQALVASERLHSERKFQSTHGRRSPPIRRDAASEERRRELMQPIRTGGLPDGVHGNAHPNPSDYLSDGRLLRARNHPPKIIQCGYPGDAHGQSHRSRHGNPGPAMQLASVSLHSQSPQTPSAIVIEGGIWFSPSREQSTPLGRASTTPNQ